MSCKEVSINSKKTMLERSGTLVLENNSRPLYRRAQTATHTKPLKNENKVKYLDPEEYLAQRRKSSFRNSSMGRFLHSAKTSKDDNTSYYEVQSLIQSTERNPQNVFETAGLKHYRLLHEIINLNQTPIDFHTLAKLQKRENLIIQTNALKDDRYAYLCDSLQQTKRSYKQVLVKPVIYNAYEECEIIANKALAELRSGISHHFDVDKK